MSAHAKTLSELEISIRNKQLRKLFYEFCRDQSLTQIVSFEIVNDGFPPGMVLSTPETAHMTAHTVLNTLALNKADFSDSDVTRKETGIRRQATSWPTTTPPSWHST